MSSALVPGNRMSVKLPASQSLLEIGDQSISEIDGQHNHSMIISNSSHAHQSM